MVPVESGLGAKFLAVLGLRKSEFSPVRHIALHARVHALSLMLLPFEGVKLLVIPLRTALRCSELSVTGAIQDSIENTWQESIRGADEFPLILRECQSIQSSVSLATSVAGVPCPARSDCFLQSLLLLTAPHHSHRPPFL